MTSELQSQLSVETAGIEDHFGSSIEECHEFNGVSYVDLLKLNERAGDRKMTHGPEQDRNVCKEEDRNVCKESFVFMSAGVGEPSAPSQLDDLPCEPSYYRNSTNPILCEGPLCVSDLRHSSDSSEPGPEGPNGNWYSTFCDYIHSSSHGVQRHSSLTPLSGAPGGGNSEMRGTAPEEEYGQMESYRGGILPRSMYANQSSIKTEDNAWVDVTNSKLRFEAVFPGMRVFLTDRRVCQVCGDDASGCHYGAVTCGSCKVFFKRAAEGKQNHLCASRNDCTIDKLRRKNCASCRLRRCFLSGMSLKGRRLKGHSQPRTGAEGAMQAGEGAGEGRDRENVVLDLSNTASHGQSPSTSFPGPFPSLQSCLSLLSVLQAIEPSVVHAGHDPAQPDSSGSLLTSLNELGERQLVKVVRWAKAIPGFRDLHVEDQMSVIQSSWMGVMVFGLAWRSYTHTGASMLYFAPDLVFNDQRMRVSSMYDHCVQMCLLSQRFGSLTVTREEFLCMKALLLFSIIPVEGLKNQRCFDELRTSYIKELDRLASQLGETTRTQRLFQLTQLLDYLQPIVRKLHQFTYDLFIQAQSLPVRVSFPEMISEIVSVHVPKILRGLVQPIFFHKTA